MKFLLIPDKFKGSLTSEEVARGIQTGIEKVIPRASFLTVKASDGGDGFLDAIARYRPCIGIETVGQDPLGKPILCKYLYNQERTAAYVELANASGFKRPRPNGNFNLWNGFADKRRHTKRCTYYLFRARW